MLRLKCTKFDFRRLSVRPFVSKMEFDTSYRYGIGQTKSQITPARYGTTRGDKLRCFVSRYSFIIKTPLRQPQKYMDTCKNNV